jgi:predicted anti-sigma-YlaC factor YlaD
MNHQPFEDWLFADYTLSSSEKAALEQHLQVCDACRELAGAWGEIEMLFRRAPLVQPEVGFAQRWHTRLANQQEKRQRRQTLGLFAFYVGGAAILLLMLILMAVPFLQSPAPIILALAVRFTSWFSIIDVVIEFMSTLLKTIYSVVPTTLWIGIGVALLSLCFIWIIAFRRLTSTRRIVV